jgi:hypothetical protein
MNPRVSSAFARRYGLDRSRAPTPPAADSAAGKPKGGTNETAAITITFRAVDLTAVSGQPEANKGIAFDVLKELQNSPPFNAEETKTSTDVTLDGQTGTFTFSVVAQLKVPLKL